ncbi:hypothetical protein JCM3765_000170 [Sporobolomyces pararoseus]
MSSTPRAGGGNQSAWAVNWRNPQARKNKSWEHDGYLQVVGPALTLWGEDGNKMGQKNFLRPLAEEMEITIAGKEIRLDYSISVQEMWSKMRGEGSSRGTPAPVSAPSVRPGFFSRTTDSHTTPQLPRSIGQQQNRMTTPALSRSTSVKPAYRDSAARPSLPPSSLSRSNNTSKNIDDDVFRADTPEIEDDITSGGGGSKTWIDPKKHLQKPFKFPTPVRRVSPGLEYGVTTSASGSSRGKSKMYEEIKPKEEDDDEDDEEALRETQVKGNGKGSSRSDAMARLASSRMNGKGKEMKRDQAESEEEENSPSQEQAASDQEESEGPGPPKKRKLDTDNKDTPSAVAVPIRKPRVSAADLALSRSMASSSTSRSNSLNKKPTTSSSKLKGYTRRREEDSDSDSIRPKAEPMDSDDPSTTALFLDASGYQDDEFGIEGEGGGMDWDVEGNDLNEDGLFDAISEDDHGGSRSDSSGISANPIKRSGKKRLSESTTASGGGGGTKTRYFTCHWRKQSTKKNPSWEGDGILRIDKNGRASVRDTDTGKDIAATNISKNQSLEEDTILRMGGKEIEIGTPTDRQAYDEANPNASVKPAPSSSSSRPINSLPGRSSSAATPRPTTPSLSKGFSVPGIVSKPLSSAAGIKTGSFYGKSTSTPQNTMRGPSPLFDPKKVGAIVMKRPDKEHQQVYNPKNYPIVDVVIDPKIGDELRPHQKEGVQFMYEAAVGMSTSGQGCILADEMGLGKTIQSIALIWTLIKQNPYYHGGFTRAGVIERAMIVCPVTLIKNWQQEIRKWLGPNALRVMVADGADSVKTFANSKSYQVLIVGYEKLTSSIDHVKYAQPPIGLIICDEGHRLKSANTKTAKAIASLSCLRRVILSGTPIQNNLQEFFAMMNFVNPGLLMDSAYFKKNYETPILKARRSGASKEEKRAGKEASESLANIQRNFFLRRTSDLLRKHLPPKLEYTVFVVPTSREVEIYDQILSSGSVRSLLSGKGRSEQLSLLILLRKCATTPGLLMQHAKSDLEKKGDESIFQPELTDLFPTDISYTDFRLSAKLIALGAMLKQLHEETDEKIVVVSNFTQTLDIVERHCKKLKYPFCRLDGKTDQKERIPMVKTFNNGSRKQQFIFLLSSKSGGTGLNIIGASRLVLLDSEWNPSTDLQAMARIHREGQTRTCVIYRFLTSGTIDEKIYQRQITKIALSGSVMEEDSTSTSGNKGDAFTVDDLKNIFRLHTDTACQTHDLLDCGCHRGENPESFASQDQDDDSSEAEEDDDLGGFVPASQWAGEPVDKRAIKKAHRNLSILKTWNHYDCSDWGHTSSTLADEFLRDLILKLQIVDTEERCLQPYAEMSEDEQAEAVLGNRTEIRGGQIGWVFEKKNDEKEKTEKESSVELVEEKEELGSSEDESS